MKKILPINTKPKLTSYVHHSYVNAIVDRECIASLYINNIEEWKLNNCDVTAECDYINNMVYVKERVGRKCETIHLKKKYNADDEVIVKLAESDLMNSESYINISLDDAESDASSIFAFHWNQYDITVGEEHIVKDEHFFMFYKVVMLDKKVQIGISKNTEEWNIIYEKELNYNSDNLRWSIDFFFGSNQYEKWINMNYIQLNYDPNDVNMVYLDYYIFPRKGEDASYHHLNQFIDTKYEDFQELNISSPERLHQFIKDSIANKYYLNICFDEFYIANRRAFQKERYAHYNLLFGVDDEEKVYYILGYDLHGKLAVDKLKFDTLEVSILKRQIVKYKYCVNKYDMQFNIGFVLEMIKEFLESKNSDERFAGLLGGRGGVYGVGIFDQLMDTELGRRLFLKDKRITYVLFEHADLMRARLDYLSANGYIAEDMIESLHGQAEAMIYIAEKIKNVVIKRRLKKVDDSILFQYLGELKILELNFYNALYMAIKGTIE